MALSRAEIERRRKIMERINRGRGVIRLKRTTTPAAPAVGSFAFNGTSDNMSFPISSIAAGSPLTVIGWFKPTAIGTASIVGGVGLTDGTGSFMAQMDSAGALKAENYLSGVYRYSGAAGPTVSTSAWNMFAIRQQASTSRSASLGTTHGAIDTTTGAAAQVPQIVRIGTRGQAGNLAYFNGRIAHVAVWDVALTDAQINQLAGGANPQSILPGNLKFYAPLNGSVATDSVSGTNLTASGGTASTDGPTISA